MTTGRINQVTAFFLFPRISLIPFLLNPPLSALLLAPEGEGKVKREGGETRRKKGKTLFRGCPLEGGSFIQ